MSASVILADSMTRTTILVSFVWLTSASIANRIFQFVDSVLWGIFDSPITPVSSVKFLGAWFVKATMLIGANFASQATSWIQKTPNYVRKHQATLNVGKRFLRVSTVCLVIATRCKYVTSVLHARTTKCTELMGWTKDVNFALWTGWTNIHAELDLGKIYNLLSFILCASHAKTNSAWTVMMIGLFADFATLV